MPLVAEHPGMKFSLLLATVGRTVEVNRFVAALDGQSYRDFELVVIDQNPDDRLSGILRPFTSRFPILHLRSATGLSRARNVGLKHVSGDIVAFPDDDCWYPQGLLAAAHEQLATADNCDGVIGRSVDEGGSASAFQARAPAGLVDRYSVWTQVISYTIFLRRAVVEKVGIFDEDLGVGAGTIFGSGEETDYIVRALSTGCRLLFSPDLYVHHPDPDTIIDKKIVRRAYSYGCGMGRVLAKHRYPIWFRANALIRPLAGGMLSIAGFNWPKATLHWSRCAGRMRGMRSPTTR